MNSFLQRFTTTGSISHLRRAHCLADEDELSDAAWGSEAGFGNLSKGPPTFIVPDVQDVSPVNPYFQLPELIRFPARSFLKITYR